MDESRGSVKFIYVSITTEGTLMEELNFHFNGKHFITSDGRVGVCTRKRDVREVVQGW